MPVFTDLHHAVPCQAAPHHLLHPDLHKQSWCRQHDLISCPCGVERGNTACPFCYKQLPRLCSSPSKLTSPSRSSGSSRAAHSLCASLYTPRMASAKGCRVHGLLRAQVTHTPSCLGALHLPVQQHSPMPAVGAAVLTLVRVRQLAKPPHAKPTHLGRAACCAAAPACTNPGCLPPPCRPAAAGCCPCCRCAS